MKKAIAILSFICYFTVTSGVTINFHYCMKKLASVRLFETKARECGVCGMDTHEFELNGCCRDEVKIVKLVQDQNSIALAGYELPVLEAMPAMHSGFIVAHTEYFPVQTHFHNHSPPLLSGQDIYLRNNVFRI